MAKPLQNTMIYFAAVGCAAAAATIEAAPQECLSHWPSGFPFTS